MASPRILLLSQREFAPLIQRCCAYEFEDVVRAVDEVTMVSPRPGLIATLAKKFANRTAGYRAMVRAFSRALPRIPVEADHDVLFVVAQFLSDLPWVLALGDARQRCGRSVLYLEEVWTHRLDEYAGYLDIFAGFDCVFVNCANSVEALRQYNPNVHYVPPGVDALRFCPYPDPPPRSVDVCNLGRKSVVTHAALIDMVQRDGIFYLFDSAALGPVRSPQDHRILLAGQVKRSRFFVTNLAKPERRFETNGQAELGFRFFEGAAGGAVLIGDHPKTQAFEDHLGWEDSVIHVPYDAPDIAQRLADLQAQPARLAAASERNVVHSLRRHDWGHRWRAVLERIGVAPTDALRQRLARLEELATSVETTNNGVPSR